MQHKSAYIWGLVGKFLPQALYLGTTMFLARYLSPDDFGTIGVLSILFTVATVLLDSGLGGSLIKEKNLSRIDCSSISAFNIIVSIIIYITLYLSANLIENFYNIDNLAGVVRWLSLVFPITALGIVPKSLLQRDIRFKAITYNYVIGVTAGCIASIIMALCGLGVYAIVAYQLVTNAVSVAANFISSRYRLSFRFSLDSIKRLLPFGVSTSIVSIIDTIYENLMTVLIGKYMSVQQAGYMYQAKRLEEVFSTSLSGSIGVVLFPILTKLKDDHTAFIKEAMITYKTICLLSFPVITVVAIFATELMILLFGEEWISSGYYLEMLSFAGIFIIMETLIRNFIKALCEVERLMYATVIKRIIGIGIMIVALIIKAEYVVYGYIISAIIGYVINSVVYLRIVNMSKMQYYTTSLFPIFVCCLLYIILNLPIISAMGLAARIPLCSILVLLYYFCLLPKMGISLTSFIKK